MACGARQPYLFRIIMTRLGVNKGQSLFKPLLCSGGCLIGQFMISIKIFEEFK